MTAQLTHPPIDPELAAALAAMPAEMLGSFRPDQIVERRATMNGLLSPDDDTLSAGGRVVVSERTVTGPAGAPDISFLILTPAQGQGPWPCLYHVHGGGMIIGNNRTGLDALVPWVIQFGLVVVSVEYRLAPEHPDPAPVQDCYAGLVWTAENHAELGIDPERLIIVGTSAGGGLAAGTALMARDLNGPKLAHQMLLCPMLDDRSQTPSSHELDGEGVWDRTSNETGWSALLGDRVGGPDVSYYAAPARAVDLQGLPPAFVDVGSVETFRDEDILYAMRLSQAGISAELHVWPGGFHGFDGFAPHAALSQIAVSTRTDYLRRALAR